VTIEWAGRLLAVSTRGTEPSTDGPLRRTVVVKNPQGLHVRPAAAFAGLAARFESRVTVSKGDGERVDGKFWPDLLLLAAEQGTKLELEVDGPDAMKAIEPLAQALAEFREDETPVQPAN
jgi:phosphotransferase system HPr (HPr) family protein